MLKHVLLLSTMLCTTYCADQLVSQHCKTLVEEVPRSTYVRMAAGVEKPLHMFHEAEWYSLGVASVSMFTLCFAHSKWWQAKCGRWIESDSMVWTFQIFWVLAILFTAAVGGVSALFEGIAQGYEQQGGVHFGFFNGFGVDVLLEFITILAGVLSLILGPPGGWSGQDDTTWL